MEDGEQRNNFYACSRFLSEAQAVLKDSCPMRNPMVAAERQGVIFKNGFQDGLQIHGHESCLTVRVCECRNPYLQRMFQWIGAGDKAGSGIDKIRRGWDSQQWRAPTVRESTEPDRVKLVLPMVSLIRVSQCARGYQGRTPEAMQAEETARQAEDAEYDQRCEQLWGGPLPPSTTKE